MTKATDFMNSFMEDLKADYFVKDNQPNKGPDLTLDFVNEQVETYSHLIKSEIFNNATATHATKAAK